MSVGKPACAVMSRNAWRYAVCSADMVRSDVAHQSVSARRVLRFLRVSSEDKDATVPSSLYTAAVVMLFTYISVMKVALLPVTASLLAEMAIEVIRAPPVGEKLAAHISPVVEV